MEFKDWLVLDEAKDACYHKVKSRYRVWPSAYASGALVKCRKAGYKNWGNSKKNESLIETLANQKQYSDAINAAMALLYKGIDASMISSQEILKALKLIEKKIPEDTDPCLFAARVKSAAKMNTIPQDFQKEKTLDESSFDLENKKGLHGWFSRKTGGWIDCKASRKGNLVPCGRKKAGKGAERSYPACRPKLSMCNKSKNKKKSSKRISWKSKNLLK